MQSWKEMRLDLRRRGLTIGPGLAVAGAAPGFWKAREEVWPKTRGQRCWVHKTANVLNKLPKSQQAKAKRALAQIWMAGTNKDALVAFGAFVEIYAIKYAKAAECLTKDRDALLAFYGFPAEHWKHLRPSNPVESTFAAVRHRTLHSKRWLSNKLAQAAAKHWRRLDGQNQLPTRVRFTGAIEVANEEAQLPPDLARHQHSVMLGRSRQIMCICSSASRPPEYQPKRAMAERNNFAPPDSSVPGFWRDAQRLYEKRI